jgi:hypothetical protein
LDKKGKQSTRDLIICPGQVLKPMSGKTRNHPKEFLPPVSSRPQLRDRGHLPVMSNPNRVRSLKGRKEPLKHLGQELIGGSNQLVSLIAPAMD